MIVYVIWFFVGLIIDKAKNKILGVFIQRSVKMIKWKADWHSRNQPFYMDLVDWILV